ncbi:hypothetical protein E1301_Tti007615 [Triplophysa tibetana]|uniref:Uncharacterized protein n=1 Tax=Triplophysa tibetana TaxID=1572043 RepID=A0A5A9PEG5_9TELE|nr:hypothetical protein E1301_Tti007615 [Triplophysa tibetana]
MLSVIYFLRSFFEAPALEESGNEVLEDGESLQEECDEQQDHQERSETVLEATRDATEEYFETHSWHSDTFSNLSHETEDCCRTPLSSEAQSCSVGCLDSQSPCVKLSSSIKERDPSSAEMHQAVFDSPHRAVDRDKSQIENSEMIHVGEDDSGKSDAKECEDIYGNLPAGSGPDSFADDLSQIASPLVASEDLLESQILDVQSWNEPIIPLMDCDAVHSHVGDSADGNPQRDQIGINKTQSDHKVLQLMTSNKNKLQLNDNDTIKLTYNGTAVEDSDTEQLNGNELNVQNSEISLTVAQLPSLDTTLSESTGAIEETVEKSVEHNGIQSQKNTAKQSPQKNTTNHSPQKIIVNQSSQKNTVRQSSQKNTATHSFQKKTGAPSSQNTAKHSPQKITATHSPQNNTVDHSPQKKTVIQSTQKNTASHFPQKNIVKQSPQMNTVTHYPQINTVAHYPQINTITHYPQINTVAQYPQINTVAQYPQINTVSHPPQKNTVSHPPQKNTVKHSPQKNTITHYPHMNTVAYSPQNTVAHSPQRNTVSHPHQKNTLKHSAQKNKVKQSPQKNTVAHSPQKNAVKQSPQKKMITHNINRKALMFALTVGKVNP